MSYLPQSEVGFFEAVQVYFTELTGRVALFGARDRELLEQWRDRGLSARVVCRGMQKALAAVPDEADPPRSLYQFRDHVDREWERFRKNGVGGHEKGQSHGGEERKTQSVETDDGRDDDTPSGLFELARRAIEKAGKTTDDDRWRSAYRRAWRELKRLHDDGDRFSLAEIEAVDTALIEAYLDALDEAERESVEESVAAVSAGLARGMSPEARQRHLEIQKKRALVERFGLLDLIEALY